MVPDSHHLLLTRPQAQAERFAASFTARFGADWKIVISPLIEIGFLSVGVNTKRYAGLIFTSENGVLAYAETNPDRNLPAYCVGQKTAQAGRRAGLVISAIAADAKALVQMVAAQKQPGPLLHLHGEHTAGDVAQCLNSAGTETEERIIYTQTPRDLTAQARSSLSSPGGVLLPLFSPRTARLFQIQAQAMEPDLRVAALSQAVADSLAMPIRRLEVAQRPDGPAMLDALALLIAATSPA